MALPVEAQISRHAMRRGAQSNLCVDDFDLVRRYGVLEHRTGVRFYFVRKRDVDRFLSVEPRLRKLHDIVMVVAHDDTVITVYRNRHALKDIKRKLKFR